MLVLYQGPGSGDFELRFPALPRADEERILSNAIRLLAARGRADAAATLRQHPWRIFDAENSFDDDFCVLVADVSIEDYEALRVATENPTRRRSFRDIADVVSELGPYIRFVALELQGLGPGALIPEDRELALQAGEIHRIVYDYIGVQGGYLADFSYQSHHRFYLDIGLDINPYNYSGRRGRDSPESSRRAHLPSRPGSSKES